MGYLEREINRYTSNSGVGFQQDVILISVMKEIFVLYFMSNRLLVEEFEGIKSYQVNLDVLVVESLNMIPAIIKINSRQTCNFNFFNGNNRGFLDMCLNILRLFRIFKWGIF